MLSRDLLTRMRQRANPSTQEGIDLARVIDSYEAMRAEVETLRKQVALLARAHDPYASEST